MSTVRSPSTWLVALEVVVILFLPGCGSRSVAPSSRTSVQGVGPSSTSTSTTSQPPTASTTTTAVGPSLPVHLGPGATGAAVLALQRRLASLGYWLGTPDGRFSDSTEQAAYAVQKAAGITRDGIVGPVTEVALARGALPHPHITSGHMIEVDLEDDRLMFVNDGRLTAVLNTSTGGGYTYTDDGITAVADTPTGIFHVYRQVNGMVTDYLGQLWRPKFFDDGFAIHSDSSVPPNPVSHGCVRVSDEAIDRIWEQNLAPVGTEVWVY